MQKIVPNIWCQGNADEVGNFYAATFPDTSMEVSASYPETNLPDFQQALAGQPLVVDVTLSGYRIRLINAGGEFRPTPAISFILSMDPAAHGGEAATRANITSMWAALVDGGEVRMELGEYPHSKLYGWVEDRYGVNWQVMMTEPTPEPRPLVTPQFLFTGDAAQAQLAMDLYTGLFPGARTGVVVPHEGGNGAIVFAEFALAGQWFSAMDGGADHHFTFSPGISLEVDCADQEEIDTLWEALSAVPEAEQCGWLSDRFGVSWQIVPQNMGELMQRPGAYQRMLAMKKIVVADL
ncbi:MULTISPECIES: VOC family protein [Arthrobacter]|uniref:PhnB-like domain-containing protein n=1 Tax=Arthrobacter psychrochitiniphilus TaxID=291045 RepID=A0A2V3DPD5_9MICC|nr:VOC family protein [Arthrobacter psychrochitiniphilus]NYG17519.1 putative 3-demethylubiquinone-9 3-methyltransferase (glyoxalase superfamily) [Arthrobacter psychrochitiniphilus]PXA64627.1 hypothetical protein CVS29_13790 [Arthrobacter psychrochitiniphilus]